MCSSSVLSSSGKATIWREYQRKWTAQRRKHKRELEEHQRLYSQRKQDELKEAGQSSMAADGNKPLHKSLRLREFYVDLGESLGTSESTRAIYERILDLRIATPQIIFNYAMLLKEHKYFEDAFKVYERGVKIFKYPHVKDIRTTYLSKFVKRFGKSKVEGARELFEHVVEIV